MPGANVEQAVVLCVMLEEAARVQLLAAAAGTDGWEYPDDDVATLKKKLLSPEQFVVNFDYLARQLTREPVHRRT